MDMQNFHISLCNMGTDTEKLSLQQTLSASMKEQKHNISPSRGGKRSCHHGKVFDYFRKPRRARDISQLIEGVTFARGEVGGAAGVAVAELQREAQRRVPGQLARAVQDEGEEREEEEMKAPLLVGWFER